MASTVRIPWVRQNKNEVFWNEVCAWAIEYFGLPGDRFITHANIHCMDFVFKSNKDALVMALRWNAEIVPNDQLTVEFIGSLM
jgi:hypothetical protein